MAVVTGATGGWGSGAATALLRRGATVILNARTRSKIDRLAARLDPTGTRAIGIAKDVSALSAASDLVDQAIERCGRLDVLVNCTGKRRDVATHERDRLLDLYGGDLVALDEGAWQAVIDAELTAVYTCTKAAVGRMIEQGTGGAVISVIGTHLGAPGQSAHAAAKSAVLACTWSWSEELRQYGITVNGVSGYVRSLLTDPTFDTDHEDLAAGLGTGSFPTQPADAGELVAWLASSSAQDISGRFVALDGRRVTLWDPSLPDTAVFREPCWTAETLANTIGPILRRRHARPTMVDLVSDLLPSR